MHAARLAGPLALSVLMASLLAAPLAQAAPVGGPPEPIQTAAPQPVLATAPAPLPESMLDSLSGGDGGVAIAVSNQRLQAVNTGNSVIADTVNTGSVSLDHGALSGFNGLGNVVINTGNNNNLQSSLNVSIVTPR